MSVLNVPQHVPGAFRQAVLDVFPALRAADFTVAGRGWHSLAIEAGGLIFKFPDGAEAEAALRREARILRSVRPKLSLAVPDMALHEGALLFSSHPKIAGATLEPAAYAVLGDSARERLAQDLARFFAELRAIDPRDLPQECRQQIGGWDTTDEVLEPVWATLPDDLVSAARDALSAYRRLEPDPAGEGFGFFDAHGWNLAFDQKEERLNGVFDFADSGTGPLHREFVPVSLVDPDLARRCMGAFESGGGRAIDRRRVYLLTAAMRLSEYAGALDTGILEDFTRTSLELWLRQPLIR